MIGIGIIGLNFGRTVLLPAFRSDPRCEIVALAGSSDEHSREVARAENIRRAYGDWRDLIQDPDVTAIAIATNPGLQTPIALAALQLGKPIFAEKPLAKDLDDARLMLDQAAISRVPAMVDFSFHQIESWQRAKAMLDHGEIGALRHVVVHWHFESQSVAMKLRNWKVDAASGGGVLGNFVSHSFHYLEWFCGPIIRLSCCIGGLPNDKNMQVTAAIIAEFSAGFMASVSVSCASFLGSGHRIEFYGDKGSLTLANSTTGHMSNFELLQMKEGASPTCIMVDGTSSLFPDGRTVPVAKLVTLFIEAVISGTLPRPNFEDGFRAQQLIDAAQISHRLGKTMELAPKDFG